MVRVLILSLCAWLSCGTSVAAGICQEVIVSNEGSRDLAIVDPVSLTVVDTISVGQRPRGMALSRDREQLFVALSGSPAAEPAGEQSPMASGDTHFGRIGVVDLITRRLVRTIEGASDPERVAVSADGRKLFVTAEGRSRLMMIDVDSGALLARTTVGTDTGGLTLSPSGSRLYLTSEAENRVSVIDARSAAVLARFTAGSRPHSTSFSRDGLRAYVANQGSGNISVIDTAGFRRLRNITLPEGLLPFGTAVPPAGSPLYVSTGRRREVLAIDSTSSRIVARAESGARPRELAMAPNGSELYVANGPSNDLSVFTLPQLKLRTKIHTGEKPWGVVCRDNWWTREALGVSTAAIR